MNELTAVELAILRKQRWTAVDARAVLQMWRASRQSMAAFGRRNGVGAQRLSWWNKRLADWRDQGGDERASEPSLVPAIVRGSEVALHAAALVVRLPSGIAFEIADPGAVAPPWLAAVVSELSRAG
jgi:hypothetical protein